MNKKTFIAIAKILLTIFICYITPGILLGALFSFGTKEIITGLALLLVPAIIPLLWLEKKKVYLIIYLSVAVILGGAFVVDKKVDAYMDSITIDVTPNIYTHEYLPFEEDSKIVKLNNASLKLSGELPVIDGATAAFPVYSAFVHAVYPDHTRLYDGVFEYNNTMGGYRSLAEKETDVFFGAYPSKEQREYAAEQGTTFEYTQIGYEAFVFFVHKDNPINNLTAEQIRAIYSGEIKNWSEVGGNDEKIVAFQRNSGSGSQSMMLRFMGDTPLMEPDMQEVIGGMGEIIEEVADYKSRSNSIGFSFRYYVEGIIQNPDIKVISVDGVHPSVENIQNETYPIIAPVYAVTYEGNTNENVDKLIEWVLSDEGQYIIRETGYVGMK
ncbi:MAG: hypothetical protein E7627_08925 [Ruminococcaceae bacterium]|nr:hypothetical protein [Oscillospiraceae bacterium]